MNKTFMLEFGYPEKVPQNLCMDTMNQFFQITEGNSPSTKTKNDKLTFK